MVKITDLKGIVVPIMTTLTEDEQVDERGLRKLIGYILDGGVHGIFVMGTSGEFARMNMDKWKKAVEITIDEVRGRVPTYVGVSDAGASLVGEKAHLAQSMNADVLVATPPYYFPVTQEEIFLFYKEVTSDISTPLLLYNIPSTTHVSIELETIIRLSEIEGIIGIKDSAGDLEALRKTLKHFKGNGEFRIFVGAESIMRQGMIEGAHGGVPSTGNVAPKLLVDLYKAAKEGDAEGAKRLEERLFGLHSVLNSCVDSQFAWLIGRKAALDIMGICGRKATSPSLPLSEEAMREVENGLKKYNLIPYTKI